MSLHHRHGIPSFDDVVILTHIHIQDRESIQDKIPPVAKSLESICIRVAESLNGPCDAVIVTTDPFLSKELRDPDHPPHGDDFRKDIHLAVEKFPRVRALTSDTISDLVSSVGPLDIDAWHAIAGQTETSTYQLPKVSFTLIRAANPECRIVQFDEDGLLSENDIVAATSEVVEASRIRPNTIFSVGYKPVYDDTRISDPRLAGIINGTSTRTGQLANARHVLQSLENGDRKIAAQIDVDTGEAFLAGVSNYGPDVETQVIAGGALLIPGNATVAPYSDDRNLCLYGDDDTLSKLHRLVDGIDCERLTGASAPQTRDGGGMPTINDVIWHAQKFAPRLSHGISLQGAISADDFGRCLLNSRRPDEQEQQAIWTAMVSRLSEAVENWSQDQFADTVLGVFARGPEHPLFKRLKRFDVVGGSYASDGLRPEIARLREADSLSQSRTMSEDTLGACLNRTLEDITLYLDPRFQRLWKDLREAVRPVR